MIFGFGQIIIVSRRDNMCIWHFHSSHLFGMWIYGFIYLNLAIMLVVFFIDFSWSDHKNSYSWFTQSKDTHAACTLKNERKYLKDMLQATMLALSSKPLFPAINLTIGCNSTNRLSESSKQCVCVSLIFRGFLFLAKIPNWNWESFGASMSKM